MLNFRPFLVLIYSMILGFHAPLPKKILQYTAKNAYFQALL